MEARRSVPSSKDKQKRIQRHHDILVIDVSCVDDEDEEEASL